MNRQINLKDNDFRAGRGYSARQVRNICTKYYFEEIPIFKIAEQLVLKDMNQRFKAKRMCNDKFLKLRTKKMHVVSSLVNKHQHVFFKSEKIALPAMQPMLGRKGETYYSEEDLLQGIGLQPTDIDFKQEIRKMEYYNLS